MENIKQVLVIGAGTMGAGIAQVAATAGHPVLLYDAADGAAERGLAGIDKFLGRSVDKGKIDAGERDAIRGRITACTALEDLAPAKFVIEAIVEDLDIKRDLFGKLEAHPNLALAAERPEFFELRASGGAGAIADEWHSDLTCQPEPSVMAILHSSPGT